jgi:MFS family permease
MDAVKAGKDNGSSHEKEYLMFFGWRVVAGSFVSMMLVVGFFTYSFTLLVSPIREEFGASLEQVMYGLTVGTLLGLVVTPISGILIDRHPVRLLMVVGCVLVAGGFWSMAYAPSIFWFNLAFALTFSLGNGLAGVMAGSAAVSRWFIRSRGRALGITTIGTSLGGMAVPALTTYWLTQSGWRGSLENLALLTLLLVTPFVWLNVRGRPEDLDMVAEGAEAEGPDTGAVPPPAMGMAEIVRQPAFWLLGFSVGLLLAAFSSMIANLSPYATRLGASEVQASTLVMSLAVTGLIGKIVFGMAADRISLKLGMWTAQGLVILGFLILAAEPPYALMLVAAMCMGLATGGLLPVWNAMMAHIFGVDSYGRAMGAMGPLITLQIMPAYAIVGRLFDETGNYTTALFSFIGVLIVAVCLLIPLQLPQQSGNS